MTAAPAARRAATLQGDLVRATLRALGRLGFATLILFHAWLLGQRLVSGQAFDPATTVRWVLSVLVLVGFRALRRRGLPLFLGRRAVGLWLLVVILHCSAAWEGGNAAALDAAIPEAVTVLAQFSAATLVLRAVLAAVFALMARGLAACSFPLHLPGPIAGLPSTGFAFSFSPRPPPLA